MFFRVQVLHAPGFSGSRFFRVRVQGPGFRSSRDTVVITPLLRHYYDRIRSCLSCLSFSNNYFDNALATIQDSFPRDIRNSYLKNILEGSFVNFNLIYIGRSEKKKSKDYLFVLGYEIMVSRTFL